VNEYRIHRGKLELRTRNPEANLQVPGKWRKVESNEIMLHLLLDTVVGRWLMGRRGFQNALEQGRMFPALNSRLKQAA
jgi:hypothetical protein